MRGVMVGVVLCCGGVAAADTWPTELVDRPLVILPGATGLELDGEYRTAVSDTMRVDDFTPDVEVWHGFGPVELGFGIGKLAYAWAEFDLGGPALIVGASTTAPQSDDRYVEVQRIGVIHKVAILPSALAAVVSATAYLDEARTAAPESATGLVFSVAPAAGVEMQIDHHWALSAGTSVYVPLAQSSVFHVRTQLSASGQLLFAIPRWDFFLSGAVYDITRSGPSTYASAGFVKRWF